MHRDPASVAVTSSDARQPPVDRKANTGRKITARAQGCPARFGAVQHVDAPLPGLRVAALADALATPTAPASGAAHSLNPPRRRIPPGGGAPAGPSSPGPLTFRDRRLLGGGRGAGAFSAGTCAKNPQPSARAPRGKQDPSSKPELLSRPGHSVSSHSTNTPQQTRASNRKTPVLFPSTITAETPVLKGHPFRPPGSSTSLHSLRA